MPQGGRSSGHGQGEYPMIDFEGYYLFPADEVEAVDCTAWMGVNSGYGGSSNNSCPLWAISRRNNHENRGTLF